VAGRFNSAAGGCAAQQITRRVLLSHAILDADYEQAMADGQTFSVINETRILSWSGRYPTGSGRVVDTLASRVPKKRACFAL
jgi:hypothetical protein